MMSLKSIIFFLFLPLVFFSASAQINTDSLKNRYYSGSVSDSEKAEIATQIANELVFTQPDSARFYAREGLKISKKLKYYDAIFNNCYQLGRIELTQGNLEQAIQYYQEAVSVLDHLSEKRRALAPMLNLGYLYDIQNEYVNAYKIYVAGIDLAKQENDSSMLYSFYNNFGSHLKSLGDFDASKEMFRKTLTLASQLDKSHLNFSPASALNNLALIYLEEEALDSALYYLQRAWNYPGARNDVYGEQVLSSNFAEVFLAKNQVDSAKKYLDIQQKDLQVMRNNFDGSLDDQHAEYYSLLGEYYFTIGEYQNAEQLLLKALALSRKIGELEIRVQVLKLLSELNKETGNNKRALDFMSRYAESLDSLKERTAGEEILRLKARQELDTELLQTRNQLEVVELQKKQREMTVLIVIVLAVVVVFVVLLLYLLQRTRHKRLQTEHALHRMEKEKVAEELEFKKREMTTNAIYRAQRENLVQQVSGKLQEILKVLPPKEVRQVEQLLGELGAGSRENNWQEFEKRFKEVHTDFYQRLSQEYPKLTAGDLRLSGFLRLNMSNKEIAAITYQNVDTIKTARYRLRKKLGLSREVNLIHFLTKF